MNPSDSDLVKRSIAGDSKAFGRLVKRYQKVACAVAYNIVNDFSLAEDVAQTAFVAAYNTLGKLKDPTRFSSWLFGIVSHMAVDQVRRRKRSPLQFREVNDLPDRAATSKVPQADPHVRAHQLVRSLDEPMRQAVTLNYLAGLTYKQIGEVMAVPASTVRGYIARGMAQLRKAVQTGQLENGEAQ